MPRYESVVIRGLSTAGLADVPNEHNGWNFGTRGNRMQSAAVQTVFFGCMGQLRQSPGVSEQGGKSDSKVRVDGRGVLKELMFVTDFHIDLTSKRSFGALRCSPPLPSSLLLPLQFRKSPLTVVSSLTLGVVNGTGAGSLTTARLVKPPFRGPGLPSEYIKNEIISVNR